MITEEDKVFMANLVHVAMQEVRKHLSEQIEHEMENRIRYRLQSEMESEAGHALRAAIQRRVKESVIVALQVEGE